MLIQEMQLHALIGLSYDVWLGLLSQFSENINFCLCVTRTDTFFFIFALCILDMKISLLKSN